MFDKAINIKGKHGEYARVLAKGIQNTGDEHTIFKTNIALYKTAVIVGVLFNQKADEDKSNDKDAKIMPETVIKYQDELMYLFRLVMLTCADDIDYEKRIDRAFRYNYNEKSDEETTEDKREALKLFESYALGGIEKLYNVVYKDDKINDKYLENMFEFIDEVYQDYQLTNVEI